MNSKREEISIDELFEQLELNHYPARRCPPIFIDSDFLKKAIAYLPTLDLRVKIHDDANPLETLAVLIVLETIKYYVGNVDIVWRSKR